MGKAPRVAAKLSSSPPGLPAEEEQAAGDDFTSIEEPVAEQAKTDAAALADDSGSMVLIAANVTIDGDVKRLVVRAADRSKKVAEAFVKENGLGKHVARPVVTWLKKIESETEKFPVTLD